MLTSAAMCEPSMELGVYHFPDFPLPHGETPYSTLCKLCWEGAFIVCHNTQIFLTLEHMICG